MVDEHFGLAGVGVPWKRLLKADLGILFSHAFGPREPHGRFQ